MVVQSAKQRIQNRDFSVLHPQEVLKNDKSIPVFAGIATFAISGIIFLYKKGKVIFVLFTSLSLYLSLTDLPLCLPPSLLPSFLSLIGEERIHSRH
jgi:hypothetical protein